VRSSFGARRAAQLFALPPRRARRRRHLLPNRRCRLLSPSIADLLLQLRHGGLVVHRDALEPVPRAEPDDHPAAAGPPGAPPARLGPARTPPPPPARRGALPCAAAAAAAACSRKGAAGGALPAPARCLGRARPSPKSLRCLAGSGRGACAGVGGRARAAASGGQETQRRGRGSAPSGGGGARARCAPGARRAARAPPRAAPGRQIGLMGVTRRPTPRAAVPRGPWGAGDAAPCKARSEVPDHALIIVPAPRPRYPRCTRIKACMLPARGAPAAIWLTSLAVPPSLSQWRARGKLGIGVVTMGAVGGRAGP
jgi:hypothetical protein